AIVWSGKGHSRQAGIDRTILVLHDHDPVAPAVESEIEGRRIAPGITGVRVIDEDDVGVADNAIGIEKEAQGDGAAIVLAANPAEDAVIVTQLVGPAFGFISTMRATWIDQGLEGVRLNDQVGVPLRLGRDGD